MKQASVLLATALAVNVLPVPGGPYSNTPLGGSIPVIIKCLYLDLQIFLDSKEAFLQLLLIYQFILCIPRYHYK
jgi:hypothetical protein